jgi:glycosyltransferase involved in cell wall biosynthesis
VFHEFVAVSTVPRHCGGGERYILLVGAPWYLKGADLLIEAFRRLAADFPDVKLKLLGHYPDWESLDALSRGAARIELLKARPNPEALAIIARASIFCLPSRCEGMGRVILEAMAAGVPVVASNVGGIPHLMRHGGGGRLVPTGDVSALESELRALLSDSALMTRIGLRGYEAAHAAFNEQIYTEQFTRMVDATVRNDT